MTARAGLPLLELAMLAFWLGAAALLAVVVAPAAFAVLPSRTLAGALVGRILPVLFWSGMAFGAALIAIEGLGAGRWLGARAICGALTLVACAVAQLVVGARIDRVRAAIAGPVDSLALADPRRVAFGRLHAMSVAWLGVAIVASLVAAVLAARAAARPSL